MFQSLVMLLIDYGNAIIARIPTSHRRRLQSVLNTDTRLIHISSLALYTFTPRPPLVAVSGAHRFQVSCACLSMPARSRSSPRGVDHGGVGRSWPLKICRRDQSMFWPPKTSHSFIQKCCWITLQVSHHEGWTTYVKKWKVKLISRGTWNSLMAWPDWPRPLILRQIYATVLAISAHFQRVASYNSRRLRSLSYRYWFNERDSLQSATLPFQWPEAVAGPASPTCAVTSKLKALDGCSSHHSQ